MFGPRKAWPDKLNIAIVAAHFPVQGRASQFGFLWPVTRGLARLGHRVTVISWLHPEGLKEWGAEGVKVYFVGTGKGLTLAQFPEQALLKFNELHSRQPFHLVHGLDAGAKLIAEQKKELGVAVAFDVEATQLSQIFSILSMSQDNLSSLLSTSINVTYKFLTTYYGGDRKLLKSADTIFVTNPPQAWALERFYLYPELKTQIVPYGIEVGDLWSAKESSVELKKKLNLPDNGQVVVTVTDMTEITEAKSLLKAFEKVAIKRSSSRLVIIGNGPLFKQIEYEMLCLALGSRVIFTGAVSAEQMAEYISLADVYVSLGAHSSGFDPSLLEAMAQKKVVIASEVSPIATLIEDGVDGFLVRPADTYSLATLILQIFATEMDVASIGEKAREKVIKIFEPRRMVEETLRGYEVALSSTKLYGAAPKARPKPENATH